MKLQLNVSPDFVFLLFSCSVLIPVDRSLTAMGNVHAAAVCSATPSSDCFLFIALFSCPRLFLFSPCFSASLLWIFPLITCFSVSISLHFRSMRFICFVLCTHV